MSLILIGMLNLMPQAYALSTIEDIRAGNLVPTVEQPIVGPSHEIPPTHWSYRLVQKLQREIGLEQNTIALDGEHAINRTEMAVLLSDISAGIKVIENKLTEREQTQFEILQEEFQSEIKVLEARIVKVEASVQKLSDKVDQQLLAGTTARKQYPSVPEIYGALHAWSTRSTEDAPMEDNFRLRRANIGVKGDISEDFHYNVMFDPARSTKPLKDLWLDYTGMPHHTVRVGQMKPGTTFDSLRSSSRNLAIDRSLIGSLGNEREQGAALIGEWKYLDYQLGAYSGEGENNWDANDKLAFAGRVTVRPLIGVVDEQKWGKLELGGSVFQGKVGDDSGGQALQTKERVGMEARYRYRRFELNGEYLSFEDPDNGLGDGWYVEAGYQLTPKFQLLTRYDRLDSELNLLDNRIQEYLVGVNYILDKYRVRLGLNYVYRIDDLLDTKGSGIRLLVQHVF